ncbi:MULTISPECIES: hypothetical protein [unclassified Halobacteriovorax]|uniref:hypothetical protein n=1 Tax=unclassified Halobacteriovorax TaxID=2639665 RepID=UPI002FEFD6E1
MSLKHIISIFIILAVSTSCQMTGDQIQNGQSQMMAERIYKESDILDAVDDVIGPDGRPIKDRSSQEAMEDLTDDYTNFPSSNEVNNYINESLSFNGQCRIEEADKDYAYGTLYTRGSMGARRVLATIYQSCDAIDFVMDETTPRLSGVSTRPATLTDGSNFRQRVITNRNAMVNSHAILSQLDKDPEFPSEKCIDTTQRPPVYGYGSRKGLRSREINLFTRGQGVAKNNVQASGIDCSEFISAAFAAEGLKFNKSDRDFNSLTTTSLHYASDNSDSCVKPVEFDLPYSIQSGDIINLKGSHVLMVDTAGPDPLGIRGAAESNSCNSITINDFDFTYIHSGALNNYGPARVSAKIHATKRSTMFNNLLAQARTACTRLVQGRASSQKMRSGRFSILRHDSGNPACYYEDYGKLKGEECINQCFGERRLNDGY